MKVTSLCLTVLLIMPWARALAEVQAGNIDLLPATWFTEQRTSVV